MSMAIPDMLIQVRLETAQVKADMANLENKFKGLGTTVAGQQNHLAKFGKSLLAAAGVGLSIAGIVGFTKNVIAAGEESQRADARLLQVAKSMGIFGSQTTAVTERLKSYADGQARLTGVDDEVIKKTQAKLLTFSQLAATAGVMNGAFDRATKAAVDMAAAGFGEATQNAVQLGKALQDPIKGVTALTRSGITFTEEEKKKIETLVNSNKMLDAQAFVLKAIETQVGGTAAASATATDKMKQAFGQVEESIGEALLPMVEKFSAWVVETGPKIEAFFKKLNDPTTEVGKKWQDFTTKIKEAFDWVVKNAEGIKNFAIAIGLAAAAWGVYTAATALATTATQLLSATFTLSPFGAVVTALALIATGMFLVAEAGKDAEDAVYRFNQENNKITPNNVYQGALGDATNRKVANSKFGVAAANAGGVMDSYNYAIKTGTTKPVDLKPIVIKPVGDSPAAKAKALAEETKKNHAAAIKIIAQANKEIDAAWDRRTERDEAAYSKHADAVLDAMSDYAKDVAAANKTHEKAIAKAHAEYAEAEKRAIANRNKAITAATEQHNANVINIQKTFAKKMADVIAQSMGQLRDAFAKSTSTDIGGIFKEMSAQGEVSADALIGTLKTRLEKIKTLAKNAAALSGAGFSQTFIEQVVSQGPDVGNKLAESLMAATPEAQSELQKLFADSQDTSAHAMDALSKEIYDKTGLATEALKSLYAQVQVELNEALAAEAEDFKKTLANIQADFDEAMASARATRDAAIAEADAAWTEQLETARVKRDDAIKAADKALKDALIESAKTFITDLKDIETEFNTKIAAFKTGLAGLSTAIGAVRKEVSIGVGDANTVIINKTPGSSSDTGGSTGGGSTTNNNLEIKVETNTSPESIANAVLVAMKFGIPVYKEVAFA